MTKNKKNKNLGRNQQKPKEKETGKVPVSHPQRLGKEQQQQAKSSTNYKKEVGAATQPAKSTVEEITQSNVPDSFEELLDVPSSSLFQHAGNTGWNAELKTESSDYDWSKADMGDTTPYSKQSANKSSEAKHAKQNHERIKRQPEGSRSHESTSRSNYKSDDNGYDQFCESLRRSKHSDVIYTKVIEIQEDLFNMPSEYSLAHCVAQDMNMGSGIAVRFSQQFKRREELYSQRQRSGGLAVLKDKERYIYYLVTKRESNGKPTMLTLWNSLQKLRKHIEDNNVKQLAIPRIGCGLDRLEWSEVKYMLECTFREVDVKITVCNYQQSEDYGPSLPPRQMKCKVTNALYPLVEIENGTAILYFGTEDGFISEDIEDLDKKFRIIIDYKSTRKQLGDIIHAHKNNDAYSLYGCIVRKTKDAPFDFMSFHKCITQIKKKNKDYYYVAFQAFLDSSDDLIVNKIVNMLRHSLIKLEIYVCWGGKMKQYMPQQKHSDYY